MAIFNSYVKLPEGIYWKISMMENIIRHMFNMIVYKPNSYDEPNIGKHTIYCGKW